MTDAPAAPEGSRPAAPGVHAATILCEVCGKETPHRIVHLDPAQRRVVSGLARCRECRTTHPFRIGAPALHDLFEIVSDGPASTRILRKIPALETLTLGERFPGRDPPCGHPQARPDGWPSRPHRGGPRRPDRLGDARRRGRREDLARRRPPDHGRPDSRFPPTRSFVVGGSVRSRDDRGGSRAPGQRRNVARTRGRVRREVRRAALREADRDPARGEQGLEPVAREAGRPNELDLALGPVPFGPGRQPIGKFPLIRGRAGAPPPRGYRPGRRPCRGRAQSGGP